MNLSWNKPNQSDQHLDTSKTYHALPCDCYKCHGQKKLLDLIFQIWLVSKNEQQRWRGCHVRRKSLAHTAVGNQLGHLSHKKGWAFWRISTSCNCHRNRLLNLLISKCCLFQSSPLYFRNFSCWKIEEGSQQDSYIWSWEDTFSRNRQRCSRLPF